MEFKLHAGAGAPQTLIKPWNPQPRKKIYKKTPANTYSGGDSTRKWLITDGGGVREANGQKRGRPDAVLLLASACASLWQPLGHLAGGLTIRSYGGSLVPTCSVMYPGSGPTAGFSGPPGLWALCSSPNARAWGRRKGFGPERADSDKDSNKLTRRRGLLFLFCKGATNP